MINYAALIVSIRVRLIRMNDDIQRLKASGLPDELLESDAQLLRESLEAIETLFHTMNAFHWVCPEKHPWIFVSDDSAPCPKCESLVSKDVLETLIERWEMDAVDYADNPEEGEYWGREYADELRESLFIINNLGKSDE